MLENEADAHALVALLGAAGVNARVAGEGVHWQVEMRPLGSRTLLVHCFRYTTAMSGLILGVNPANSRSRLRGSQGSYEGPEYLVILEENGSQIADGRTRIATNVVTCAKGWLSHAAIDQLIRDVPFVDEKPRAMRALAKQLDPLLRLDGAEDPGYELWVYGEGRSCRIQGREHGIECSFLLGQAQAAYCVELGDIATVVKAWLVAGLPLRTLAARFPGVELERHAEVLETDPARWHWLHVRDRLTDPKDVLAPMRELIEALASSPIATRFFTYSSLNTLCFSASSHYPWVGAGLPVVSPAGDRRYDISGVRCDANRAMKLIETTLAASPLRAFFGSKAHYEFPILLERLERQGSLLRPELVQREAWYDLVVADAAGVKRCKVSDHHVTFFDATDRLSVEWPSLDDAVDAIRQFCEKDVTLDRIAKDPRAHGST